MKTRIAFTMKSLFITVILFHFVTLMAQTQSPLADGSQVKLSIDKPVVVNDSTIEFDIYLKDVGSGDAKPFELSIIQAGILVSNDILNNGNVRSSVVQGFSDLNPSQQPANTMFVKGTKNSIVKVAAKNCPGPGNGTIIKRTGKGTKICRIRLNNSVAFATGQANLTFSFTKLPYPTKIFRYIDKISKQITTDASNCFGDKVNPVINKK